MHYFVIASYTCDNSYSMNDTIVRMFETKAEAEAGLRAWFKATVGREVIFHYSKDKSKCDKTIDPYATTDVEVEVEDENGDKVKETRKTSLYLRALERMIAVDKYTYEGYEFDEEGLPALEDMQSFANDVCEALDRYKITLPTKGKLHNAKRARVEE